MLLGYWADGLRARSLVRGVLALRPDCPADFALEVVRLHALRRQSDIDSALVALVFDRSPESTNLAGQVRRMPRSLDMVWEIDTPGHHVMVHLLALAGPAAIEGFLVRIEGALRAQFDTDFQQARIGVQVARLTEAEPEWTLDDLLARCRVPSPPTAIVAPSTPAVPAAPEAPNGTTDRVDAHASPVAPSTRARASRPVPIAVGIAVAVAVDLGATGHAALLADTPLALAIDTAVHVRRERGDAGAAVVYAAAVDARATPRRDPGAGHAEPVRADPRRLGARRGLAGPTRRALDRRRTHRDGRVARVHVDARARGPTGVRAGQIRAQLTSGEAPPWAACRHCCRSRTRRAASRPTSCASC